MKPAAARTDPGAAGRPRWEGLVRFFGLDALAPLAKAAGGAALDLVFPPVCMACRRATGDHGALCSDCWREVAFIDRPWCERLGTPFETDYGPGLLSPQALADPPVFGRARAAVRFDEGPARLLVYRLKYYDRLDLADAMAGWMVRAGGEFWGEAELLVPVPLHRLRLSRRRYNQAGVLAQALAARTGVPVAQDALERVKPTAPQVGLSRARRAANLSGAFRAGEAGRLAVAGRRVVLVDDVLTSGATANAAARALLRAGAANVDVLTFARVVSAG